MITNNITTDWQHECISRSDKQLARELSKPSQVIPRREGISNYYKSVQAWLAYVFATLICDRTYHPVSMTKVNWHLRNSVTPAMKQVFGVVPNRMMIFRARKLAGIITIKGYEIGLDTQRYWVRFDSSEENMQG